MGRFIRWAAPAAIVLIVVVEFLAAQEWLGNYKFLFASALLGWSYDYFYEFSSKSWEGWVAVVRNSSYYPPGYEVIAGFVHYKLGFSRVNFALINSIFLAISGLSIYAIGKKISGVYLGFFAAALFLLFPAVVIFSRVPSREIALMGAISLAIWSLINSNQFANRKMALLFAFSFSMGMMIKWTFFGFIFFPIAWFFISAMRSGMAEGAPGTFLGLDKGRWINIIISCALIFAALAPWYMGILDFDYLSRTTGNDPTETDNLVELFGFYLGELTLYSRVPMYWVLVLCLIALSLKGQNRKNQMLIAVWFASAYLIFSVIPHKESRNIFPLIPAACILMASGLDTIKFKWAKALAGVAILVLGASQFYYFTYTSPLLPTDAGALFKFENPECAGDTDKTITELFSVMTDKSNIPDSETTIKFGTHPFNHDTLYLGDDQIGFYIRVRDSNYVKPPIQMIGYGPVDYDRFYREREQLEFVTLSKELFTMSHELMMENVKSWKSFESPENKVEDIPYDDPGFLKLIKNEFEHVHTIQTPCVDPVFVYKRKQ